MQVVHSRLSLLILQPLNGLFRFRIRFLIADITRKKAFFVKGREQMKEGESDGVRGRVVVIYEVEGVNPRAHTGHT